MNEKFKGVFPAFYACYDEEGNVSAERVKKLAVHLLNKGVKGIYVGGSSGECIYQDVAERKLTLESVMEAVGGKMTVIVHVACNNTRDSQELAAHAESLGVDAIASIPPIYFKLPADAIAKYWNDISSSAPHTPFIIYNIPQLAGVALTPELLKTMLQNPNVIGVKNSSMATQDIEMFEAEGGKNFLVFNGPDEQFIAGRAIGATGGIGGTYAVMPELFLKIDECFRNGDMEKARGIQYDVDTIIYKMCSAKGNLYAVMKEILKRHGVDCGSVRAPLLGLQPGDEAVVQEADSMIETAIKTWINN